jgi:serine-type D-Ala-D-Ala carboxypeptidase/endopeptidase (penicillin-binding protein 4)
LNLPRAFGPIVSIALLSTVCAARPATFQGAQPRPAARSSGPSVAQLQRDLTAIFNEPSVDHAFWGVRVNSLETDESLFNYNAHRLMVPASNQKLITAAVAAERLGWDYRFTTRLLTNGDIDASGTLKGDLIVVSDGDPSINPRHPERWRAFDDWSATLAARGIRVIEGQLIGDDNLVDEPGWGEGWSWDDLQYGYGTPTSALQYNENQVEVTVGPGLGAGAAAIVATSPGGSGLLVDSTAVTVAKDAETTIEIVRMPGTIYLSVRGQIAEGATPVTALAAVDNPTHFYLSGLRDALVRRNIFIGENVVDIDALPQDAPLDTDGLRELIVDRSPPLFELIDVMLKWSRNDYAETLLTALSPLASTAVAAVPPARNAALGLTVLQSTLESWGIAPTAFRSRDGSGLSRMDVVSADGLVRLLTRMWKEPRQRELFRSTLPVAGVSGTLAERLKNTAAVGRVWAKTGSMSNIRALSGYLETKAGEPLVFSVIVNNFVVPTSEVDAVVDRALLKLIELPRRSRR